jgi:hypothetical protein
MGQLLPRESGSRISSSGGWAYSPSLSFRTWEGTMRGQPIFDHPVQMIKVIGLIICISRTTILTTLGDTKQLSSNLAGRKEDITRFNRTSLDRHCPATFSKGWADFFILLRLFPPLENLQVADTILTENGF